MRIIFALPLLAAAACNVDNDSTNDQVTVEYNQQRVEDAAAGAAQTAREIGSGIGNIADSTARAIDNEVGDIDVDLNISRDRDSAEGGNAQ